MSQIFEVKDKRVTTSAKLKNHLIDDADIYFNPDKLIIVAASSLAKDAVIISNSDYKSLKSDQPVGLECVSCAAIF